MSHSSQIANAASAAIDDTAMKIPMTEAVWQGAPAGRLNSHGEKNNTMPSIKFATSQSLGLDHSSMTASVRPEHWLPGWRCYARLITPFWLGR